MEKNAEKKYRKILNAMDVDEAVAFVSQKVKEAIESCQKLQKTVANKKLVRRAQSDMGFLFHQVFG